MAEALITRTEDYGIAIVKWSSRLARTPTLDQLNRQVVRSGTSIAANYRSACRGRSRREFIAKLGVAVDEADETVYWLTVIPHALLQPDPSVAPLREEAEALRRILGKAWGTARQQDELTK